MSLEKLSNLLEDYEQIDKVKQDLVKRISALAKDIWGFAYVRDVVITRTGKRIIEAEIILAGPLGEDVIQTIRPGVNQKQDLLIRVLAIDGVRLS